MPSCARRLQEIAEEIAIAEKLRASMERHFGRVVGDDAAGVDDDPLRVGALPLLAPPADVVARGVELGDVGLHPPQRAAIPGLRGVAADLAIQRLASWQQ